MKNQLIIHGHFYQPPREDPDTGVIPIQPSADPFSNWNERITRECYAANAFSRILGGDGRITEIVNNYRYLSFNFGPTLLQWLVKYAPRVYDRIREADSYSMENNNGHGNAIAQAYNHTILPLDTPENRLTQILWGIEDFRHHFERDPEGLWLPETAVNLDVIDSLIDCGIRFIILSPWQAEKYRHDEEDEWTFLEGNPAPSGHSCYIKGSRGRISAFFYDPALSSGISFQHYLTDADVLYDRLAAMKDESRQDYLITAATDGEIYGHHEPFGDMCLAALVNKIHQRHDFRITNYAAYLEEYPPVHEAVLLRGEEEKGTSWSCVHGVSRWYKDCGCSTGGEEGWNQKWRTPLRNAFNLLCSAAGDIYSKEIKKLTATPPDELRNSYIHVILGKQGREAFCLEHLKKAEKSGDERKKRAQLMLRLLEGQKYSLFMFTSCGWFFSDISGLEPVQNLKYAFNVITLYSDLLGTRTVSRFEKELSKSISNISDEGTGRDIFITRVRQNWKDPSYVIALLAVYTRAARSGTSLLEAGDYTFEIEETGDEEKFHLRTLHVPTAREDHFLVTLPLKPEKNPGLMMKKGDGTETTIIPWHELTYEARRDLYRFFRYREITRGMILDEKKFNYIIKDLEMSSILETEPTDLIKKLTETTILTIIDELKNRSSPARNERMDWLNRLLSYVPRFNLELNTPRLSPACTKIISQWVDVILASPSAAKIEACEFFIKGLRGARITPDIAYCQNRLYHFLRQKSFDLAASAREEQAAVSEISLYVLIAELASVMGIDTDRIKHQFISLLDKS